MQKLQKETGCAVAKEIISKIICLNHIINLFSLCLSKVTNYVSNSVNVNLQISKLRALYCTFRVMPRGQSQKRANGRKSRATSAPPYLQSPQKRLKWDNASMIAAMEEVKQGNMNVKHASVQYGVPHTIHETQPLNTAVYGPLKSNWQSVCHNHTLAGLSPSINSVAVFKRLVEHNCSSKYHQWLQTLWSVSF